MEKKIDYKELYKLQDEILRVVSSLENDFYLTGGTALHRFFCIAYYVQFNLEEMLMIANKKAVVEKDIFIYRLKSFPLEWLDRIKKIKEIEITKDDIELLCDDVLNNRDNSLVRY